MVAAAASYYKATLNVTTGLSAPYNNLAIIYKQQVMHIWNIAHACILVWVIINTVGLDSWLIKGEK